MVQLAWRHHYLQRNNIYTNQIGSKHFLLEGSVSYWIDTLINLIYIQVSGQGTGSGSGTNVRFRLKTLICLKCQVRTYPEDDHFWFCQIEKWIEVNSIKLCQVHIIWMIEKIALSGIFKFVFWWGIGVAKILNFSNSIHRRQIYIDSDLDIFHCNTGKFSSWNVVNSGMPKHEPFEVSLSKIGLSIIYFKLGISQAVWAWLMPHDHNLPGSSLSE